MTLRYPLVDVNDVEIERAIPAQGPSAPDFRLAIGAKDGSATAAFHLLLRPRSTFGKHVFQGCDAIVAHLSGRGVVGMGDSRAAVRPGHCRLVPAGTEHFVFNDSQSEDALIVGFLVGARDLDSAGFENRGAVSRADLDMPRTRPTEGLLVHLDDVQPEVMSRSDGWLISDFRLPIGRANGASSALFRARFRPGAVHKKHRHENCDEIYYVISGRGFAGAGPDRTEVRGGHFHYIPSGVEHWLCTVDESEPIEVVGIYIGAGSVAETGYVYMGDVTAADLERRVAGPSEPGKGESTC